MKPVSYFFAPLAAAARPPIHPAYGHWPLARLESILGFCYGRHDVRERGRSTQILRVGMKPSVVLPSFVSPTREVGLQLTSRLLADQTRIWRSRALRSYRPTRYAKRNNKNDFEPCTAVHEVVVCWDAKTFTAWQTKCKTTNSGRRSSVNCQRKAEFRLTAATQRVQFTDLNKRAEIEEAPKAILRL